MASSLSDKLIRLQFIPLRVVCFCPIFLIIVFLVSKVYPTYFFVVLSVTFVHHFASAFGPKSSLPGALDLLIILLEFGALVPLLIVQKDFSSSIQWYPWNFISYTIFSSILCLFLLSLALLRITEAFTRGRRFWVTRYDVTGTKWTRRNSSAGLSSPSGAAGATNKGDVTNFWLGGIYVLFGRSIWRKDFLGETRWLVITRGIFAASLLIVIALYAFAAIIVQPLHETALLPVQEFRTLLLPFDFNSSSNFGWNLVVARPQFFINETISPDFSSAIKVISILEPDEIPCTARSGSREISDSSLNLTLDVVSFYCPTPETQYPVYPNILVVVNFTMLNIKLNSTINRTRNSLQVMLGLTNVTTDVLDRTLPTMLIPGMNVVGTAYLYVRETFIQPKFSAFGLFDSVNTFWTAEIGQIWPDPEASIPRSSDVATIRIIPPWDTSEYRIIRDLRNKSVLSGFSSVGGLWTVLAGVFAALFGSSIMRVLFEQKPISVTGITHSLKKGAIRDAYMAGYPRLVSDLKVAPEDRGLLTFISDHIVDFEFLAQDEGSTREEEVSIEKREAPDYMSSASQGGTPLV